MLERNDLAKAVSTNWEALLDSEAPQNINFYVPWISKLVYFRLRGEYRNEDDLADIVNEVIINLITGIENGHYTSEKGINFRSILREQAKFKTLDHFRLRRRKEISETNLITGEDDQRFLESVIDKRSEDEFIHVDRATTLGFYIESLIPLLILFDESLCSIKKREEDESFIKKQVKKLITMTILPCKPYLELSTPTGDVELPPKVLQNLIGFSESFKRKNIDNYKNRELPKKLKKIQGQIAAPTGSMVKLNERIAQYREHLNSTITFALLESLLGVMDYSEVSGADSLPSCFLKFVKAMLPKSMRLDALQWINHYSDDLDAVCAPDASKLKRIFSGTP